MQPAVDKLLGVEYKQSVPDTEMVAAQEIMDLMDGQADLIKSRHATKKQND